MNLKDNFRTLITTVQQKVQQFVENLRQFNKQQDDVRDKLYDLSSNLYDIQMMHEEYLKAILHQEAYDAADLLILLDTLYDDFSITEKFNFSLSATIDVAVDQSPGTSIPSNFAMERYLVPRSKSYVIYYVSYDSQGDPVYNTIMNLLLRDEEQTGNWVVSEFEFNNLDEKFPNFNFSYENLVSQFNDTLVSTNAVQAIGELYNQGQLTLGNVRSAIGNFLDLNSAKANEIMSIITENFSAIISSPSSMIEVMKGMLYAFFSVSDNSDNSFSYAVDEYSVSTSLTIGWEAITGLITDALTMIVAMIKPVVAIPLYLIGNGIKTIANIIQDNQSSVPTYPGDADFNGFGQNVKRGYVYGIYDIDNVFINTTCQAIGINTPLFTSLIFNYTTKNSLHQDLYPAQDFIIPILPTSAEGWQKLAQIFAIPDTTVTLDTGYFDPDQPTALYKRFTAPANMSQVGTQSSKASRINGLIEYMQWLNDNPDKVWIPNTDDDNPHLTRLALWFNYQLLQLCTHDLDIEYLQLTGMTTGNYDMSITNQYGLNNILNQSYLQNFMLFITDMWYGVTTNSSSLPYSTSVHAWLYGAAQTGGIRPLLSLSWTSLVNTVLVDDTFSDYGTLSALFISNTYHEDVPYAIQYYDNTAKFVPSIVPPSHSLNIWVRIGITFAIITVAAVTALITYTKIKKSAVRKFSQLTNRANEGYKEYTKTGSKASYKQWKKSVRRGNFLGKIFGFGSIDAVNNWVNAPANTAVSAISAINGLSSQTAADEGEINPTLENVRNLITSD